MPFKIIQIDDNIQLITCITRNTADDNALQFYCHHKNDELSYCEMLPVTQFEQRIRQLNKRIHFPADAVRAALINASPIAASLGSPSAEQEEQQTVLSLKYRIEAAPAPLKWEWHLTSMDNTQFFRCILHDALAATTYLNKSVQTLLEVVRKKDVELKQFRIEGYNLRRTTVVTERFDADAFQAEHKQLLADVSTYEQVAHVLNFASAPAAVASIKTEAPAQVVKSSAKIATTIPCSTTSLDPAKTISTRNRKRKVMETGIQHVERKALQRRRVPQLLYKDSQSQEDCLDACIDVVKAEEQEEHIVEDGIKKEAPEAEAISPDTSLGEEIKDVKNELDEIMQLINYTAQQTNEMIKQHGSK